MNRDILIGPLARRRLQRRPDVGPLAHFISRAVAVGLGLLVAGIALQLTGRSAPALAGRALSATLGSAYGIEQAFILATPIILTGLAVGLGMRMRLWNIGAEGQFFMGAWAATAVGLFVPGPALIILPLMLIAGALGGALWILLPALARAYANVNEIITTLLLNSVAILLVNHFAIGPWRDRGVGVLSATAPVPHELPLLPGTYLHIGIILAVLIAVLMALAIGRTRWGYEISVIGNNRRAAEFAGMPVVRTILVVMLLSGAIAGVAGMVELAGTAHRLSGTISNEYGFTGIIVAAMANANPFGIVVVGFLFAVLLNAGIVLQTQGLSLNTVLAINGLILLFAAVAEVIAHYRLVPAGPGGAQPLTEVDAEAEGAERLVRA